MPNGNAKILVVEDDPVSRELLAKVVRATGNVPLLASNGRLAWEMAVDNRDIELVITDMQMPDMNGRSMLEKLRSEESFASIPVIMVSGVVSLNEVLDLLTNGVSRFVPKPFKSSDLQHYIRLLLDGRPPESMAMI